MTSLEYVTNPSWHRFNKHYLPRLDFAIKRIANKYKLQFVQIHEFQAENETYEEKQQHMLRSKWKRGAMLD